MSLTKQLYEQQQTADAPATRITNINRQLSIALRAACDCEHPDFETLDRIARALCKARDEVDYLAASVAQLEPYAC